MRLFFAIDLDGLTRDRIAAEQRRLRALVSDAADLRWVEPAQLHLTLVFLGEVAEPDVAAVVAVGAEPIQVPPFRIAFGRAGMFPPRGAPRVLWLGAVEGAAEAGAVQRVVADRAAACGIPLEPRPFRPHLTLARVRGKRGAGRVSRQISSKPPSRTSAVVRIHVEEVTLFRSTLSPRGSTYTALARAPLAGPPLQ